MQGTVVVFRFQNVSDSFQVTAPCQFVKVLIQLCATSVLCSHMSSHAITMIQLW